MGQVEGKVSLITGGASGIGAACAATLAREGSKVVITDLNASLGEETAARIRGEGGEALFLEQNVTQERRWLEVVAEAERRFGKLNILVSNAGIGLGASSIVDMSLADWKRQIEVNLDGVFLSVKYSIPAMRRSGEGGSIIMMSSISGIRGSPYLSAYCATKGGVRLFSKAVAMECAIAKDGIRVNTVHPGIIDTPIWGKLPDSEGKPFQAAQVAKIHVPLGMPGLPQDIANGVLYLASDASRYVTGTELVIDGGATGGGGLRDAS
jgi:NAD(P)-dependent dehydrogenase (short-subunit alcohol dehydrogenase family)